MSDDVDLSHVDPRRLAEVRHRIALVREYAALNRPSGADTKRYASQLGMGTSQFGRLVKAWREQGRLPDGEALETRIKAVANSRRGIASTSREQVNGVIAQLGFEARFTDILNSARAACRTAGVPCPSQGSIWSMVQERRADSAATCWQLGRSVLIARCGLDLRIEDSGKTVLAQALIAVAMPERRVIRATLQLHPARDDGFATMVAELASNQVRELLDADGEVPLGRIHAILANDPRTVQQLVHALLCRRVLSYDLDLPINRDTLVRPVKAPAAWIDIRKLELSEAA